jgi:hypothetical protein
MSLLVLGSVVQSQNVVAHVMLPGMGELGVFTRFMAVYPIVTAACAVGGILAGGLVGLAAGTATSMLVMELAFQRLIVRTRFAVPVRRVLVRCHLPVAKGLAPVILWIGAIRALVPIDGWATLVAVACVAGLVFMAGVWTTVMTSAERRAVRERLAAWRAPAPARLSGEASC